MMLKVIGKKLFRKSLIRWEDVVKNYCIALVKILDLKDLVINKYIQRINYNRYEAKNYKKDE